MTQRIRGIADHEATGPSKELFDASNRMLGRAASDVRLRNLAILKTSTINGCKY